MNFPEKPSRRPHSADGPFAAKTLSFPETNEWLMQKSGIKINSYLEDKLCLNGLGWKFRKNHNGSSSKLLIGVPFDFKKTLSSPDIGIPEALAVIEIVGGKDNPIVQISGITNGNGDRRIVAVRYGPTGLTQLNISIDYGEFLKIFDGPRLRLSGDDLSKRIAHIPTDMNGHHGAAAGITTKAMFDRLNKPPEGYIVKGTVHSNAVIFRRNANNFTSELPEYYEERQDGSITVGLREDVADARELTSWKLIMPASLQKA